jgi:hypothetical protein
VGNRSFERRFTARALNIDVDPLMIKSGIGELLDAFLRDVEPVRDGNFLADQSFEGFRRIENSFRHEIQTYHGDTETRRHGENQVSLFIGELSMHLLLRSVFWRNPDGKDSCKNYFLLFSVSPCLRASVVKIIF